jgi:hypothetical protein
MTCADIAKLTGQHLLFLGVQTANWSLPQFTQAAQFAKAHGVDTLLLKSADGGNSWYGGMSGYRQRRDTIRAEGVGCIPYTYSYGNTYGVLNTEIAILKSFMDEDGVVCMDAEAEWNGEVSWAQHLCSSMLGYPGIFLVSTWADPSLQNWLGVLKAMSPCVDAYMPQVYSNYLAPFWVQFGASGATCIHPTVDMSQEAGPNDPVAIARAAYTQGHTALSVWHHDLAVSNPGLLDAIFAAFPKTLQEDQPMTIDLSNGTVASHFVTAPNGAWHCPKTNATIGGAILAFYQKFGGDALCGLTYAGLPTTSEIGVTGKAGVVYQKFERITLVYDPGHALDFPPGSGSVYAAHVDAKFA